MNDENYIISEDIIKKIFQELSIFNFEPILLNLFTTLIKTTTKEQIEKLSLKQKVNIYQNTWKNTLKYLYSKYLPHNDLDQINVDFEVTPYTFSLVSKSRVDFCESLLLEEDDIEYLKSTFALFKFDKRFIPNNDKGIINLTLGIAIFPPLMKLFNFYRTAYEQHSEDAKILIETVGNKELNIMPFETNIALYFSNKFISQRTYEALGGIDGLIASTKLAMIADKLREIKDSCPDNVSLKINELCPNCGQRHKKTEISQDPVCYAHILYLHPELHKYIGFCFYEEYQNDISEAISNIIVNLLEGINDIKDIKCIILVEGQTEEIAIPTMAIKYGKPLATKKIRVMNCHSKQKVLSVFKELRDNFPKLKICAIVDSDAEKEKMEFEKAITGHRNRFSFKYISKGTFEDLVPLHIALDALNSLYSIEKPITINDINGKKELVHQIKKILWDRSKSEFDKVEFIKEAIRIMQENDIPNLIKELIDDAYNLAELT